MKGGGGWFEGAGGSPAEGGGGNEGSSPKLGGGGRLGIPFEIVLPVSPCSSSFLAMAKFSELPLTSSFGFPSSYFFSPERCSKRAFTLFLLASNSGLMGLAYVFFSTGYSFFSASSWPNPEISCLFFIFSSSSESIAQLFLLLIPLI
jgi:hypothetical protein